MHRSWSLLLMGVVVVAGCAGPTARVSEPATHPANPEAPETPPPPRSTTLDVAAPVPAADPVPAAAPVPAAHQHDGH